MFKQDLAQYTSELSKRSAAGTLMSARHNIEYDYNNAPGNTDAYSRTSLGQRTSN